MSFGQWRLSDTTSQQLPPHLLRGTTQNLDGAPQFGSTTGQFAAPHVTTFTTLKSSSKPYGSGEDDNYTLVFPSLANFEEWRQKEEEEQVVEFVKGDTHTSKAVPPRFKEHVKLVCARHQRSGRKRYVKKHPERVRKVPSRKIEGVGCPASISYKTYHDKDEVRASYNNQHSHEVGLANLQFTRKGRKATSLDEKGKRSTKQIKTGDISPPGPSTGSEVQGGTSQTPFSLLAASQPGPSSFNSFPFGESQSTSFSAAAPPPPITASNERWENMQSLFNHIRDNARGYEYPSASVAALETVLIRLYLESPMNISQQGMDSITGGHGQPPPQQLQMHVNPPIQHNSLPPQQYHSIAEGDDDMEDDESNDGEDET